MPVIRVIALKHSKPRRQPYVTFCGRDGQLVSLPVKTTWKLLTNGTNGIDSNHG